MSQLQDMYGTNNDFLRKTSGETAASYLPLAKNNSRKLKQNSN